MPCAGRGAIGSARSVSRGWRRPFLRREEGAREGAAAGGGRPRLSPPVGRAAAWESAGLPGGGVLGGENKGSPAGAGRSSGSAPGVPVPQTGVGGGGVHPGVPRSPSLGSAAAASAEPAPAPQPPPQPVVPPARSGVPVGRQRSPAGRPGGRAGSRGAARGGRSSPGRAGGEGRGRVRLPSRWFLHPRTVKIQLQAVQIAGVN